MAKEFRNLITLEEALSIVQSRLPRTATESVLLSQAQGRILAEKIVSTLDVPGFSRASKDGFAVQSEDTLEAREDRPISLHLAGTVPMGVLSPLSISRGEAAEVSTGSMMPPGADSVVMVEYSQLEGDRVLIRRPVFSSEDVQAAGSDISFGEVVLFPGTKLAAREIGVLAALGRTEVKVKGLKVAVASTGNELVPPGEALAAGQIYDINTYTISAAVADCGAQAVQYGILPDNEESMATVLRKMAEECNMVLVSGSTSAGVGDMIFRVFEEVGQLIFHGVNLKPGKPAIFGLINDKPCLGLPGYPTSALTIFSCLAAPAIRAALGGERLIRKTVAGSLSGPLRFDGRRQMYAVGLSKGLVYPVDKGSGSITTLAGADGIIDVPLGVEYLDKGDRVEVELFGEIKPVDLVVAGENSLLLEKMAESMPLRILLLNNGSMRARLFLDDAVADLAAVSGPEESAEDMNLVGSFERELGLVFRDADVLSNLAVQRIVGWHRDSVLHAQFERHLLSMGLAHPHYVRAARTHSAVSAAVASGRADVGFVERQAAEEAGLSFKRLQQDEVRLLARPENVDSVPLRSFVMAVSQAREA